MEFKFDISAVESLILAAPEPLAPRRIADVIEQATPSTVTAAVAELNNRYTETAASFRIREIAGGFQFHIIPEYTGYVEELFSRQRKLRLTRASLETLAIVAYRQPVTRNEIEHIRGVASDGVVHNLMEKKLITMTGRSESVGRPLQYGTTDEFLKFFGLNSLSDLPQMREIEELLKAEEPTNQTRLELSAKEEEFVKLNVADGTFTPDKEETESVEPAGSEQSEASEEEPTSVIAVGQETEFVEVEDIIKQLEDDEEAVEPSELDDEPASSTVAESEESDTEETDQVVSEKIMANLSEENSHGELAGESDVSRESVGVIVDIDAT
ncbi:MAG: SMC-Scp complex subunit ScpB [bacterium]|nr:SMC-Scp complex subunit ScpB [bacterium]